MIKPFARTLVLILLTAGFFPLSAQFGGRPGGNGLIAVAGAASSGRIITVGGRLTPYRKIDHSFSVEGFVDTILVSPGERVKKGDPLVRLTREVVGETYRPVILESRIDGIVSEVHVYESEQVFSGTTGVTVLDNRFFLLEASLSDRDAQAVRKLGPLSVTGVSPEGDEFSGKIREITTEPDYATGLFTLIVQFPPSPGLFLGTVLFVDLPVEKPSGIAIETSALVTEGGEDYIWILNDSSTLEKRSITAGAESEDKITILQGLSAGERYIRQPGGMEKEGMSVRDLVQANMAGGSQGDR